MTKGETPSKTSYVDVVDKVIAQAVAPSAEEIDKTGAYPRASLDALGRAGLLGLINSPDVGGWGEAHRAATLVVERLATACASTAMVMCIAIFKTVELTGRLRLISQHLVLTRSKSPKLCRAANRAWSSLIPTSMLARVRISI